MITYECYAALKNKMILGMFLKLMFKQQVFTNWWLYRRGSGSDRAAINSGVFRSIGYTIKVGNGKRTDRS